MKGIDEVERCLPTIRKMLVHCNDHMGDTTYIGTLTTGRKAEEAIQDFIDGPRLIFRGLITQCGYHDPHGVADAILAPPLLIPDVEDPAPPLGPPPDIIRIDGMTGVHMNKYHPWEIAIPDKAVATIDTKEHRVRIWSRCRCYEATVTGGVARWTTDAGEISSAFAPYPDRVFIGTTGAGTSICGHTTRCTWCAARSRPRPKRRPLATPRCIR